MATNPERHLRATDNVLLFGAAGHVARPAARYITETAPTVRLRLATHRSEGVAKLRSDFPAAEVVQADYLNLDSLIAATDGMDTVFVITPDFIDERAAMTHLVAALNRGAPRHVVRLTGDPPHVRRVEQVAAELMAKGGGIATAHLRARAVLEASSLPVTFLNISAYYMDNINRTMAAPLRTRHTLVVPFDRRMNYVDPRDVGVAAAKLLLSNESYHIGKTYQLDNGIDCLTFTELAALMSEVFGEPIAYDDSVEGFLTENRAQFEAIYGPGVIDYIVAYCRWEQTADPIWRRTDIMPSLFGMKPRTLRDWLLENKPTLLG